MGLAGFYLLRDDLEQGLIDRNILPADQFDIPMGFADRVLAPDGSLLFYEDDYNGHLGDIFMINGKAQPVMHVERRKYRFRLLVGSQARWWEFRLSTGQPMLQIGNDSALLGKAVIPISYGVGEDPRTGTVRLSPAERADVIIDFSNAPDELFLENILTMRDDGRGPDKISLPGTPIMKFVVEGPPVENDATVTEGTTLRPHIPLPEDKVVATRVFEFERKGGEWAVNGEFFNAHNDNAQPLPNTVERWVLRNGGGGWSHPIHIHMGNFNIKSFETHPIAPQDQFKKDTVQLLPGEEVVILLKFSTFTGRYVFHCHNLQHEDHAMMGVFNVGAVPVDFSNVKPGSPGNIPAVQPDKGEPVPPPALTGEAGQAQATSVDTPLEFEQGEHAGELPPDGPFVPEIPADADPPEFGPPPGLID
jgi:FtsP/CotA-like multicopper oxidase with cupredoxin domain